MAGIEAQRHGVDVHFRAQSMHKGAYYIGKIAGLALFLC
jgi:hypothetical protein